MATTETKLSPFLTMSSSSRAHELYTLMNLVSAQWPFLISHILILILILISHNDLLIVV